MNQFGGNWTEAKMEIVVEYAKAYLTIMNKQNWVKTLYFDGFSGSGLTDVNENEDAVKGTALRILDIQHPRPFDIYYFVEKECYIKDVFVKEEHRKTGEATRLGDEVAKIAKSKGCTKLYGTIVPSVKGSTESMKFLLAYGFKLDSSVSNFIALVKELGV